MVPHGALKSRFALVRRLVSGAPLLTTLVFFALQPSEAQLIPKISGRVVDALSGEPIRGVNVALHASRLEGWSVDIYLNQDKLTGENGEFAFPTMKQEDPNFGKYWLTVNTDKGDSTGVPDNVLSVVVLDPMFNHSRLPVGDTTHFPLMIEFTSDGCVGVWNPTCVYEPSGLGILVRLIPTLSDAQECGLVRDASARQRCQQLNTYRSAFIHTDTYEEVQRDKQICDTIDGDVISKTCLFDT